MIYLQRLISRTFKISWSLFKMMIPIIILIRILEIYGFIGVLADLLAPLMHWVGLPGEMGLVWASALLTNLYGGIVAYANIATDTPITVAQVTVISSMMLIAHALPVEARIAQKAGVNFIFTVLLRFGMALLFGVILNWLYQQGNWLNEANQLAWSPQSSDDSWSSWGLNQLYSLLLILAIVFVLILVLDIFKKLGITDFLNRLLRPVLRMLKISEQAETITLVGITLGITYGGALLIEEAEAGHIQPKDVLYSLSLLGLSHSLIEDTLLMMVIGADISGILLGRLVFSLIMIFIMVRIIEYCSPRVVERFFVRSVA